MLFSEHLVLGRNDGAKVWRRFSAVVHVVFFPVAGDQQVGVEARQLGAEVVLDVVAAPAERLHPSELA